jgi:hypothetical protein
MLRSPGKSGPPPLSACIHSMKTAALRRISAYEYGF